MEAADVLDILFDENGDFALTDYGDIILEDNTKKEITKKLQWIDGEWRLGPDMGLPWLDGMMGKSPDLDEVRMTVRDALMEIEGATTVDVSAVSYNRKTRTMSFSYEVTIGDETYSEEVEVNV